MPKTREVTILPAAVKAWRRERKLSQELLAEIAGVSPTLVALIETGKRQPSLTNAISIANAFGVPVNAIAVIHVAAQADDPDLLAAVA